MMHCGSWIHPQSVLENHRCYTQYMEETYRPRSDNRDEESEHTGDDTHDTTTTATSGERSSSADIFRLEFAATQWSKLVSNAEGLFNKLVASNMLPHNEQDQIEQWLCMKQEYEECIGSSDESTSIPGLGENTRRSLERIEEVTETDESGNPNEFRNIAANSCESSENEMSEDDDDDDEELEDDDEEEQSDVSSENPDFHEKLDEYMNKLKIDTDRIIDAMEDGLRDRSLPIISAGAPSQSINNNNDFVPIIKPIPIRNPNSRRNSMLPGSEMCNEVMVFNGGFKPCSTRAQVDDISCENIKDSIVRNINNTRSRKDNSPDILIDALKSDDVAEPIKRLKTLTMNNEAKQTKVKLIQSELNEAHKRIVELQKTIKMKEKFIGDMVKNTESKTGTKQKVQRKRLKTKKECYNSRWGQVEKVMCRSADESMHKREMELCKNIAIHYEKRLLDIERIKQIAGDSAKKVLELEMSLNSSKKQMEKLQRQLKNEEERKNQLEAELAEDQKKIRELEEKYNLTESKLQEMRSESEDERAISRARSDQDKNNLLEVSSRISHINCVLKEKSMELVKTSDSDGKQGLRREIENLRHTKDLLVEQKCNLDEKLQKEKILTTDEERKRLECGETIEMIDAMIEHKNEMICGRKNFDDSQNQNESSEKMTIEKHLSRLSETEMKQLFYAYFRKVIDLKESSRNLEVQMVEMEQLVAGHESNIRRLTSALKHMKIETERRILIQKEHEQKLHLMFRHFSNEAGSSSHERLDKDLDYSKIKRENRVLKKRLADFEALFKGAGVGRTTSPPRIPHQELKQIAPPPDKSTTKVTRQRNKLIIQKTHCDKKKM
ncbi:hypothetical protein PV326_009394 [Microctonus aethiopoides]|nr:hypothetical protein PV326_009394 [Microctonus aethiopoides]